MTCTSTHCLTPGNIECLDSQDSPTNSTSHPKRRPIRLLSVVSFSCVGCQRHGLQIHRKNAHQSAYAKGWHGYQARYSYNRRDWKARRHNTTATVSTSAHTKPRHCVFRLLCPVLTRAASQPVGVVGLKGRKHEVLGQTLDGRSIDLLRIGNPDPTESAG